MKLLHLVSCTLALALTVAARAGDASTPAAPKEYASLLKTYVRDGGVRYEAWKSNAGDLAALKGVTQFYARMQPPQDRDTALAWYINSYNSNILQSILAKYPTKGPLAGNPLFFVTTRIEVAGNKTNFDHLEQKVIRPTFKDPRVHFALNCASASCPPLRPQPYSGGELEAQLDSAARAFINENPHAIRVEEGGNAVRLSKIFEWYKDDFAPVGGAVAFIDKYRKQPLPSGAKVAFSDYDWSLNEAK